MAEFDYASQLMNAKPQKPPAANEDFDYASAFVSGQRATSGQQAGSGQFPELGPKPITDPSRAAGFGTSLVGGIPTDKQAAIKYFAQKRGIPVTRYTIVDGDIAYQADDGKYYKEIAGPASTAAYYAPDVAEMVPDILAGVVSAPLTLGGPLGVATASTFTGGVAAGTNYARQLLGGLIGGQEVNPNEVAISGVLSGAAELAPAVRKGFVERRTARDIGQINLSRAEALRKKSVDLGVPLTPAELTSLGSLASQQKVLTNVPESQVKMQQFYKEREKKVQSAVDDYLGSLSKVEDQSVAGNRGVQALEVQRENLIRARDEAVTPIYESAFAASVPVNTAPVLSQIDNMLKTQPPSGRAAGYLRKIKDLLQKPGIDAEGNQLKELVPEDRLPNLQNSKFEIDAMFKEDAFSSLDKTVQAKLTAIKNNLLEQMGKDNPDYIAANREFERFSQPLNEFNERITGVSLMQMSPDNLKNFANRIFQNPSPETIKYAKKQIIAGGGEEAWNAVTRSFLEEQWMLAKKPAKSQQGAKFDTGNTWQNAIMGDPKQMKAMQAALNPAQFQALRDLAEVLEAAGSVRKLGSDTAFNQLVTEELMKNPPVTSITTGVARAVGGIKLDQPAKALSDWAIKRDAAANADKIASIITSPDGISRLKELRQMSKTSAKYWAGLSQLMADYGMFGTRD
jgi:hypothetical protein